MSAACAVFTALAAAAGYAWLTELRVRAVDLTPTVELTPVPGPFVQLSPVAGGPGTLVSITGRGWQPLDTVFVYLEAPSGSQRPRSVAADVLVTADGNFTASFIYPYEASWTSRSYVLVKARSSTGGMASTAFIVLPAAEAQTPAASPAP